MDKDMAKYVLKDWTVLVGSVVTSVELLCFVMVCKVGGMAEISYVGLLLVASFAACGYLAAVASTEYEEGR
jgi:hypothetical protein